MRGSETLLCNPPYTRLGHHARFDEIAGMYDSFRERGPSPASDVSGPFVEHAWRLTNREGGRAAVVVPLSVAFSGSPQFRGLRRAMGAQPGRWRCAFFDRAPDALFGDDVKTRNGVLAYAAGERAGIETTPILRWTSRSRANLLGSVRYTEVGEVELTKLIPRLGSVPEARLYNTIRSLKGRLASSVTQIERAVPGESLRSGRWLRRLRSSNRLQLAELRPDARRLVRRRELCRDSLHELVLPDF